ncbi:hypothetical protein E2C01_090582 [Portunus trituberculatus]|uniref:Uncharacterized protein n=1 Tax=Portunus trituberculatus TaxID=210409 RepID=A0A5B7JL94_PORTR|nr:hypothetical protein [Portunus trituberculatus]
MEGGEERRESCKGPAGYVEVHKGRGTGEGRPRRTAQGTSLSWTHQTGKKTLPDGGSCITLPTPPSAPLPSHLSLSLQCPFPPTLRPPRSSVAPTGACGYVN